MLSSVLGMVGDAGAAVMRLFGRGRAGDDLSPYESPEQLSSALNNSLLRPKAVARMKKMHYGVFAGSSMAENELLEKGVGYSGAVFGRPVKGLAIGISHFKGAGVFLPLQAIGGSAFAAPGHKVSAFVGEAAGALSYGIGDLIGTALAGPVAGLALGMVTEKAGGLVEDGVQFLHDINTQIRHVNMGGNYEDTRTAYTMRQRAAQELGSSVMNARAWLGKEAILMHQ